MTITPFVDLKSENILSAHISGLQHAINKIETTLNENTTVVTGHTLVAVTDQADVTLHNFIYEGTVRNWLNFPAPVIKRNGTVVATTEYTIEPAYGVIVFNAQQIPTDVITADITYVSGGSSVISGMQTSINNNATNIAANASALAPLPKRFLVPCLAPPKSWITNYKDMGTAPTAGTGISQGANVIDAFPFYVSAPMTFDQVKFTMSKTTVAANMIVGVYSDKGTFPDQLLGTTAVIPIAAGDTVNNVTITQSLTQDLVLNPGLYWIARYQTAGVTMEGATIVSPSQCIEILDPDDGTLVNGSYSVKCTGARTLSQGTLSVLPATYPTLQSNGGTSGAQYLKRTAIGNMWIHRKA